MKTKNRTLSGIARTLGVAAIVGCSGVAHAGWTGAMNGSGFGWAGVNVTSVTGKTNSARTLNMLGPSAAMAPTQGYATNAFLPSGSSTNTLALIRGAAGYIWQANTKGSNGDKTDNPELESRVVVHPSNCPSLVADSALTPGSFDGKSGSITIKTSGTAGTALWFRGFEVPPGTEIPVDNPDTPTNETTDFLKEHGVLKFENLMVGPFEYGYNDKCELFVHFTLDGDSLDNFIVVSDGVAKSNPIEVTCANPPPVECGDSFQYPVPTWTGGCGNFTYSYEPPIDQLHVGDNTVTVTVKDGAGDEGSCSFTVTIVDTKAPVPDLAVLPTLTGECSVIIASAPTATDVCEGQIIGTTTGPVSDNHPNLSFTQQGTYTVVWTYDDGNGNTSTQNQIVEVKDTKPPVAPILADIVGNCGSAVTPPTPIALDNCFAGVAGVPDKTFPITTIGTNIVKWTFTDGAGNSSTANQKVIVKGYTFVGFYSPISGIGGNCSSPAKTINCGSTVPIKFDFKCGSSFVTSGPAPVVKVQKMSSSCGVLSEPISINATYQNDWHINWDTSGWAKAVYRIIVILPDGTQSFVFVKLK